MLLERVEREHVFRDYMAEDAISSVQPGIFTYACTRRIRSPSAQGFEAIWSAQAPSVASRAKRAFSSACVEQDMRLFPSGLAWKRSRQPRAFSGATGVNGDGNFMRPSHVVTVWRCKSCLSPFESP
jgi:hypothetical protein